MTRGLKNNNPLNIRHNPDLFQGEVRPGTDKAFKQFTSAAYGYRAAFVTLGTYLTRGWDTIEKIISHWAPPNENDTKAYVANHNCPELPTGMLIKACYFSLEWNWSRKRITTTIPG